MFSVFWIILHLVDTICADTLPIIQIYPDGVPSLDFINESTTVFTNLNPELQIHCKASYPIEWIFHFTDNDNGNTGETRFIETRRLVTNFLDASSYTYTSILKMEYKGKILLPKNMTCQRISSSSQKHIARHVIMSLSNQTSIVKLRISNEMRIKKPVHNSPVVNQNCTEAETLMLPPSSKYQMPCWKCQRQKDGKQLRIQFDFCYSPTNCASIYKNQNHGKQCSKRVESDPGNCRITDINFNPKQVLCTSGSLPVLVHTFFFGVFRGYFNDKSVPAPNIYLDWAEADPQDMLYAHPLHKQVFYTGEEVTFTCEYSRYYFALGSWFGYEIDNTMEYIPAVDIRPCDTEKEKHIAHASQTNCTTKDSWRGTYKAFLTRKLEKIGIHRIFCFGPVWNSTQWINQSLTFHVEQGEAPKVLSVEPGTTSSFLLGQKNRTLVCNFTGKPIPKIQWILPTNLSLYTTNRPSNYTSELVFTEIGYGYSGKYICAAENEMGNHSRSYVLTIEHTHNSIVSAMGRYLPYLLGSALFLLVLLSAGFAVCYKKALRKQNLRILTDSEINEFFHGNPELLKIIKDDYLTLNSSLNALSYDKKYEIPKEDLHIYHNHLLGSGQFGDVFKGKIRPACAPGYHTISEIDSTSDANISGGLTVAVKISNGNLDVIKFKALLTEIKVMAYLGSHPNIVSLIGAYTKNIKNRELFMAVEYCHNGSLDVYLRNYKDACTIRNTDDQVSKDTIAIVSDLLEWSCQIANGLEYIHAKKIIHGDLGIRNILLTRDLVAKIGDFGFSRLLVNTSIYTKQPTNCPMPWKYMAVESLRALKFSVKSDTWAFGVTLWELFTLGDIPYPGLSYTPDFVNLLEKDLRLDKPPLADTTIYDYMLKCWSIEPDLRPEPGDIKPCCYKLLQ